MMMRAPVSRVLVSRLRPNCLLPSVRFNGRPLSGSSDARLPSTASRETEVINTLRSNVVDPISMKDIVSVGSFQSVRVHKGKDVIIDVDLFANKRPDEPKIVSNCVSAIRGLTWVNDVKVNVLQRPPRSLFAGPGSSLHKVQHVVAVSSCKGGVGKSTVAVNLALSLVTKGLRVGLLDADVYGPSLPYLVRPDDYTVRRAPRDPQRLVLPLDAHGLKVMSFGFVNPNAGVPGAGGRTAAVLRGPMASKVLNQLALATEWGELDYMIVDMPPGTGDIQMTLTQSLGLSGAVLVTTPHVLSIADLVKGADMFNQVKVDTLAVVENMAYFKCDSGKLYYPFGIGGKSRLMHSIDHIGAFSPLASSSVALTENKQSSGGCDSPGHNHNHNHNHEVVTNGKSASSCGSKAAPNVYSNPTAALECLRAAPYICLPLARGPSPGGDSASADSGKGGPPEQACNDADHDVIQTPVVLRDPLGEESKVYTSLADDLIRGLVKRQIAAQMIPSVTYVKNRGVVLRYFSPSMVTEFVIPASELRRRDPKTGAVMPPEPGGSAASESGPVPTKLDVKGNYGVAVLWSDGRFEDIYPFDVLKLIAMEVNKPK